MRRFLPLLLILFVASGCSALIYEIVWLQLLELSIGSTAVSLAALLGTFMGGMCLGSIALARVVSPRRHPLRVYAAIELGIGICGLLILFGMPYLDRLYAAHAGQAQNTTNPAAGPSYLSGQRRFDSHLDRPAARTRARDRSARFKNPPRALLRSLRTSASGWRG